MSQCAASIWVRIFGCKKELSAEWGLARDEHGVGVTVFTRCAASCNDAPVAVHGVVPGEGRLAVRAHPRCSRSAPGNRADISVREQQLTVCDWPDRQSLAIARRHAARTDRVLCRIPGHCRVFERWVQACPLHYSSPQRPAYAQRAGPDAGHSGWQRALRAHCRHSRRCGGGQGAGAARHGQRRLGAPRAQSHPGPQPAASGGCVARGCPACATRCSGVTAG